MANHLPKGITQRGSKFRVSIMVSGVRVTCSDSRRSAGAIRALTMVAASRGASLRAIPALGHLNHLKTRGRTLALLWAAVTCSDSRRSAGAISALAFVAAPRGTALWIILIQQIRKPISDPL